MTFRGLDVGRWIDQFSKGASKYRLTCSEGLIYKVSLCKLSKRALWEFLLLPFMNEPNSIKSCLLLLDVESATLSPHVKERKSALIAAFSEISFASQSSHSVVKCY